MSLLTLRTLLILVSLGLLFASPLFAEPGEPWPLTDQEATEILKRGRYETYKPTKEQKAQLLVGLRIKATPLAKAAYFEYLQANWDSRFSQGDKRKILEEAFTKAYVAARNEIQKWLAENKPGTDEVLDGRTLHHKLYPWTNGSHLEDHFMVDTSEFLTNTGRINLKHEVFGNANIPEKDRPPVDLIKFANARYPGSPQERQDATKTVSRRERPSTH